MYSNPSEGHTISIHALREEGDSRPNCRKPALSRFLSTPSARRATCYILAGIQFPHISIHALREEGDQPPEFVLLVFIVFLSTPSARRATVSFPASCRDRKNFYPRPPRGGRLTRISAKVKSVRFLSTPSARRATCASRNAVQLILISIHALREEGDVARALNKVGGSSISIHALREEGDVTRALLPS